MVHRYWPFCSLTEYLTTSNFERDDGFTCVTPCMYESESNEYKCDGMRCTPPGDESTTLHAINRETWTTGRHDVDRTIELYRTLFPTTYSMNYEYLKPLHELTMYPYVDGTEIKFLPLLYTKNVTHILRRTRHQNKDFTIDEQSVKLIYPSYIGPTNRREYYYNIIDTDTGDNVCDKFFKRITKYVSWKRGKYVVINAVFEYEFERATPNVKPVRLTYVVNYFKNSNCRRKDTCVVSSV